MKILLNKIVISDSNLKKKIMKVFVEKNHVLKKNKFND